MAALRTGFQGITNIIRFNWHFYLLAIASIFILLLIQSQLLPPYSLLLSICLILILFTLIASLLTSYYVYDLSGLYSLNWLPEIKSNEKVKIINIHAGFDETSELVFEKYPTAIFEVLDFYDPVKHTEPSIKRARKAYPAYPGTQSVSTTAFPVASQKADLILLILSAHEIRNENERIKFFSDLSLSLKPKGQIIVTEHLRDWPNFMAYTIGFFHFHSKQTWHKTFKASGYIIEKEIKLNPFITSFTLIKNGDPS
jgi:hypothetical protein